MPDRRYTHPVGNLSPIRQPGEMKAALKELQRRFPGLGIALFVFDYGQGGGMMYGSTAERADMLRAMDEWKAKSTTGNN